MHDLLPFLKSGGACSSMCLAQPGCNTFAVTQKPETCHVGKITDELLQTSSVTGLPVMTSKSLSKPSTYFYTETLPAVVFIFQDS